MVVTWLGTAVAEAASTAVVTSCVRRLFRRSSPAPEPVRPLSIEQAHQVREAAFQPAKALGLDDDKAALIADSFVGAVLVEPR